MSYTGRGHNEGVAVLKEFKIQEIIPSSLPFSSDDKIFQSFDDEDNAIGKPYSLNEFHQEIKDRSGVCYGMIGKR